MDVLQHAEELHCQMMMKNSLWDHLINGAMIWYLQPKPQDNFLDSCLTATRFRVCKRGCASLRTLITGVTPSSDGSWGVWWSCLGQPGCCCMLASQHPGKVESQLFYSRCIAAWMSVGVTTWQWRRRPRINQVSLISLVLVLTASAIRRKKWGSFKFTGSFINILFPISSSHRCLFLSSSFGIKVQK